MAFFVRPLTLYEEKTIQKMLEHYNRDTSIGKHLEIVWLSHQRVKSGEISRQLNVMQATALRWIKRFNREGLSCFEEGTEDGAGDLPDQSSDETSDTSLNLDNHKVLYAHTLSPTDLVSLEHLMKIYRKRERTFKRFQAILLSSQLLPVSKVSTEVGLSPAAVRFWIKQFNETGFDNLETNFDRTWLSRQSDPDLQVEPVSFAS